MPLQRLAPEIYLIHDPISNSSSVFLKLTLRFNMGVIITFMMSQFRPTISMQLVGSAPGGFQITSPECFTWTL